MTYHSVENPYIKIVLKEWVLYCRILSAKPKIKDIHLSRITFTFFSTKNLEGLFNWIFSYVCNARGYELSFEGHPNYTNYQHLKKLYDIGFTRVSFGRQDYSEKNSKSNPSRTSFS
jgi:oxygen-independent coproporphyrinogen-3 oxidase